MNPRTPPWISGYAVSRGASSKTSSIQALCNPPEVMKVHRLGDTRRAGLCQQEVLRLPGTRDVGCPHVEPARAVVRLPAAVGEPFPAPGRVERNGVEQHFELDARREAHDAVDRIARDPLVERARETVVQGQPYQRADLLGDADELLVALHVLLSETAHKISPSRTACSTAAAAQCTSSLR